MIPLIGQFGQHTLRNGQPTGKAVDAGSMQAAQSQCRSVGECKHRLGFANDRLRSYHRSSGLRPSARRAVQTASGFMISRRTVVA
jgi:hypothetical protein